LAESAGWRSAVEVAEFKRFFDMVWMLAGSSYPEWGRRSPAPQAHIEYLRVHSRASSSYRGLSVL